MPDEALVETARRVDTRVAQQMIERGYSAEEIAQVLNAGAGNKKSELLPQAAPHR